MSPDDQAAEIWQGIERSSRVALARAFSQVEAGQGVLRRKLVELAQQTGRLAHVVGITGAPGVGKSTLTNGLIRELRHRGRRVAVIAVDPSSTFTHGAVLGDRLRMADHAMDDSVFIRSVASRGALGGLAAAVPLGVLLLEGAGFDTIVVETVGVGQSEIDLARVADSVLVALAPGMGDRVQADKAGIMEIADIFVLNKADHAGAGRLESAVRSSIELAISTSGPMARSTAWTPTIQRTVAVRGEGVAALVDLIDAHREALAATSVAAHRRATRARGLVRDIALQTLQAHARAELDIRQNGVLTNLAGRVAARELNVFEAADLLLRSVPSTTNLAADEVET